MDTSHPPDLCLTNPRSNECKALSPEQVGRGPLAGLLIPVGHVPRGLEQASAKGCLSYRGAAAAHGTRAADTLLTRHSGLLCAEAAADAEHQVGHTTAQTAGDN